MILLLKCERRQQSGDTTCLAAARAMPMTAPSHDPLTEWELDVLELLEARLSNTEIAACLVISVPTVRRHAANAYRKLQVHIGGRQSIGPGHSGSHRSGPVRRSGWGQAPPALQCLGCVPEEPSDRRHAR